MQLGLFVQCHVVELANTHRGLDPSETSPSERIEALCFLELTATPAEQA